MHEGHKPSVLREGERGCCHVLLVCVVCLQKGATWLCVCVAKGHGPGWRDRASFIPNNYWVSHKMTVCWEHLAGILQGPTLISSRCRKPTGTVYVCACMCGSCWITGNHVICSLTVMFKSLQNERWKIPNIECHALRPPDHFVCSRKSEKGNSLCLYNVIARRRKTSFACKLVSDIWHV